MYKFKVAHALFAFYFLMILSSCKLDKTDSALASAEALPGCESNGDSVNHNPHCDTDTSTTPSDTISEGSLGLNPCAIWHGQVKCWGENTSGQLGLGDFRSRGDNSGEMGSSLPAIDLGTDVYVVSVVESNGANRCALLSDGKIKCWGMNTLGTLGLGDILNRIDSSTLGDNLPAVDLGTGVTATQISAGNRVFCALLSNSQIKCWGAFTYATYDPNNPLFVGDQPSDMGNNLPFVTLPAGRSALAVSAGSVVNCAILDNHTVYCWGGDNSLPKGLVNFGGHTVKQMSQGNMHACAILDDNTVRCWGANNAGALGVGINNSGKFLNDPSILPSVNLGVGRTAKKVSAGGYHTCAILDNNKVKCWGNGSDGALGLGNTASKGEEPNDLGDDLPYVDLGSGRTARDLSAGVIQTCVLLDNYSVKCWGANPDGRLGTGDTSSRGALPGTMGDALLPITIW